MAKAKQTLPYKSEIFEVEENGKWSLVIWKHDPEFLNLYIDEGCILDEKDTDHLIEQLELAKSKLRNRRIIREHRTARGIK